MNRISPDLNTMWVPHDTLTTFSDKAGEVASLGTTLVLAVLLLLARPAPASSKEAAR